MPPASSHKGQRQVLWDDTRCFRLTDLHEQDLLQPGNVIEGPAVIDAPETNTVLPPGKTYTVIEFRSGIIV